MEMEAAGGEGTLMEVEAACGEGVLMEVEAAGECTHGGGDCRQVCSWRLR